jgi:hypothetical protein
MAGGAGLRVKSPCLFKYTLFFIKKQYCLKLLFLYIEKMLCGILVKMIEYEVYGTSSLGNDLREGDQQE